MDPLDEGAELPSTTLALFASPSPPPLVAPFHQARVPLSASPARDGEHDLPRWLLGRILRFEALAGRASRKGKSSPSSSSSAETEQRDEEEAGLW